MAIIYKRSKGDITFFSDKEIEPPKEKLEALEFTRANMPPEAYDLTLASINAEADQGEETQATLANLTAASARWELLSPISSQTRAAQVQLAVDLMNEAPKDKLEAYLKDVKKSAKSSYSDLRKWADEPAPKGPGQTKSGKVRVPSHVIRFLDDEVDRLKEAAAKRNGAKKSA